MKFFDCSTAPSPKRARMFILEKGLEIETQEISLADGEQLGPDFLAINPRATVPVLVTDEGQVLTENIAIATYLEAMHPEPALMGRTPDEKASVMMWNAICEFQGGMAMSEALRNSSPRLKGRAMTGQANIEQIPELAERGLMRLDGYFELLEERLSRSPFIAGQEFSFADISAFVFASAARFVKKTVPESNTSTQAWFDSIAARSSATA